MTIDEGDIFRVISDGYVVQRGVFRTCGEENCCSWTDWESESIFTGDILIFDYYDYQEDDIRWLLEQGAIEKIR